MLGLGKIQEEELDLLQLQIPKYPLIMLNFLENLKLKSLHEYMYLEYSKIKNSKKKLQTKNMRWQLIQTLP